MIPCNYCTNPETVAQLMKYKVSRALHAVTSYYTGMKLPYVLIPLPFTCVLDCGINLATTYIYEIGSTHRTESLILDAMTC